MNAALIRHARRLFYGQALVKQTQTVLTPKPRHQNGPPGVPILGPPKQATRTSHADGHSLTKRNLLGFSTLDREIFCYLLWCQLIRCLGMRNAGDQHLSAAARREKLPPWALATRGGKKHSRRVLATCICRRSWQKISTASASKKHSTQLLAADILQKC